MVLCNNSVDEKRKAGKNLIKIHLGVAPSDEHVMRKFSKNVKPEFNRRGMPGSKKLIFNAFLVYFWLNHVAGEEMNDAASDELLSVRSLRNWFRIPEPSMIARVSKRGKINSFFIFLIQRWSHAFQNVAFLTRVRRLYQNKWLQECQRKISLFPIKAW